MDRLGKEELVSQMRESLQKASSVIVAHQTGLTVAEATQLRRNMRGAGAEFKVLKNTLAQIAVKGTNLESLNQYFQGPTALGYSQDPVAAAKVLSKFADTNDKLSIVGGYLDGQVLDAQAVKYLANLPSLDELRSKIIAVISTPATKLAVLAKEPARRVACVLAARS
ncbi:MAG: 50S ribosomal protein L10 [Alphaproteobacteria bacterium]|nr:50S ribosomal protein L10 [Alphaproteobacteria bacterium]